MESRRIPAHEQGVALACRRHLETIVANHDRVIGEAPDMAPRGRRPS